jgi:hypothetical protein
MILVWYTFLNNSHKAFPIQYGCLHINLRLITTNCHNIYMACLKVVDLLVLGCMRYCAYFHEKSTRMKKTQLVPKRDTIPGI